MAEGQGANQTISAVATIVQAVAWPAVVALIFIVYRSKIKTLFDVFTRKVDTATHLKAWQLEFETAEREIKEAVNSANGAAVDSKVPEQQVQAARELNEKLQSAPISGQTTNRAVEQQVKTLAAEYERVRASMKSGSLRTQLMNEIAAKLRALSLAARPLLRGLVASPSPGERLAAYCMLQVAPEDGYADWLLEQIEREDQAFLLFQAALAVLEAVRAVKYQNGDTLGGKIRAAIAHIKEYKGGTPDPSTLDLLNEALFLVR